MNVVQFFEYLTEHDASRELGIALAGVYTRKESLKTADARLVGASPHAA